MLYAWKYEHHIFDYTDLHFQWFGKSPRFDAVVSPAYITDVCTVVFSKEEREENGLNGVQVRIQLN